MRHASTLLLLFTTACVVVPNPEYDRDVGGGSDVGSSGIASGSSGEDTLSSSAVEDSATSFACGVDEEPSAGPCPMECDRCEGNTCVFECAGIDACKDDTLRCPPDRPCAVACSDYHACDSVRVECPEAHSCSVDCAGERACEKLELRCRAGTCSLHCGTGPESCRNSRLQCQQNDGHVTCTERQEGLSVEADPMSSCDCTADEACLLEED
jgi:hypothetical protein